MGIYKIFNTPSNRGRLGLFRVSQMLPCLIDFKFYTSRSSGVRLLKRQNLLFLRRVCDHWWVCDYKRENGCTYIRLYFELNAKQAFLVKSHDNLKFSSWSPVLAKILASNQNVLLHESTLKLHFIICLPVQSHL